MPIRARVGIAVDLLKKRAHGGDVISRVRDDTYRGIFLYAQNLKTCQHWPGRTASI